MYNLKQKIKQLFIAGFDGTDPLKDEVFSKLSKEGLGGVIYFSKNIHSAEQITKVSENIKNNSLIKPFLSIDQEGGRVERTENIHGGKKYQSAEYAAKKGIKFVKRQTLEMCRELKTYGINMNFAPVLDTNTNPDNPIIGERAYANNPDDVIKFSSEVIKIHLQNGIIPVGKHFPGHGDTSKDSHLEMPVVNLPKEEVENTHLKPFAAAVSDGIPAIMASHVYYSCYDDIPIPSSLSENVLTELLRKRLKFDGVIISDDMVMGAVNSENPAPMYLKGLSAGLNMFIYRFADTKLINITDAIYEEALKNKDTADSIEHSFEKIMTLKEQFVSV